MTIKKFSDIPRIDKIYSVLIILLPFLYQYKGIGRTISFGEMLLTPIILLLFLTDFRLKLKNINLWLAGFYLITIFTSVLCAAMNYFNISEASTVFIRLVYYAIVVWLARSHFHLEYAKQIYYFAIFAFSAYLIVQYLYHYAVGGYLPIYLKYEWQFPAETRMRNLEAIYRWGFRPSSLFLEPSYFSLFSLPGTVLLLYEKNKTKFKVITLVLTCIAMILSTASSGFFGLAIIFLIFLFKRDETSSSLLVRIIIVFFAVILVFLYFRFSQNSDYFLGRIESGGSINQRVFRGLIVYGELPSFNKIFGVGINNLEPFMKMFHISTKFDESNLNYSCSIVQTLNYSGFIGFVTLVGYLVSLKNKINKRIKDGTYYQKQASNTLYWLLVFIVSYEAILFTYRFAFLIIILESMSRSFYCEQKDIINL